MPKFLKTLFASLFSVSSAAQAVEPSTTLDKSDTAKQIHLLVWGGFETPNSIMEIISKEILPPEELNEADRKWIGEEVKREFADGRGDPTGPVDHRPVARVMDCKGSVLRRRYRHPPMRRATRYSGNGLCGGVTPPAPHCGGQG